MKEQVLEPRPSTAVITSRSSFFLVCTTLVSSYQTLSTLSTFSGCAWYHFCSRGLACLLKSAMNWIMVVLLSLSICCCLHAASVQCSRYTRRSSLTGDKTAAVSGPRTGDWENVISAGGGWYHIITASNFTGKYCSAQCRGASILASILECLGLVANPI